MVDNLQFFPLVEKIARFTAEFSLGARGTIKKTDISSSMYPFSTQMIHSRQTTAGEENTPTPHQSCTMHRQTAEIQIY
jgi:hypothetical protein